MARRVNSKFLIIFSAVLLLGAATAFLVGGPLQNLFRGDRSKKLIAQGWTAARPHDPPKDPKKADVGWSDEVAVRKKAVRCLIKWIS